MLSSFLVVLNEIQMHYPELQLYPSSNFELGWFKGVLFYCKINKSFEMLAEWHYCLTRSHQE